MKAGLLVYISQIWVGALVKEVFYELEAAFLIQILDRHAQESATGVIFAVNINFVLLQDPLHRARVVVEHRDRDGRHLPNVFSVHVRPMPHEQVNALDEARASCVVQRCIVATIFVVPVGSVLEEKRG